LNNCFFFFLSKSYSGLDSFWYGKLAFYDPVNFQWIKKSLMLLFLFITYFLWKYTVFLELTPSLLEHNHVRHLKVKKNRRNNRRDSNEIPNSIYTCV